jgi:serine/threonine protein phosphatase 1
MRDGEASPMSLTYAIPDIHGRLDLLDRALKKILEHLRGERATIVTLGDYVDRGPSSREVIELLMDWSSERVKLVNLKGNHEVMMWGVCNNLAELDWWMNNGGDQTLASYDQSSKKNLKLSAVPKLHLDWISTLPTLYVDKHRVFVHAAVDPKISLNRQNEQTLLWRRYPDGYVVGHGHRHVVHGHHANPDAPIVTNGKTNLDGWAYKTGRLVVGVFDDNKVGGAIEFLEIVGPAAPNFCRN